MKAVELSKSIEGLTGALQGRVCLPGQKNYDELRTPWLRVINQHPALIVEATSVSDIAAAVRFAIASCSWAFSSAAARRASS